jgi:hypothetical protein
MIPVISCTKSHQSCSRWEIMHHSQNIGITNSDLEDFMVEISALNHPSRWGTAHTLPKFLCCSMYCLFCVFLSIDCV